MNRFFKSFGFAWRGLRWALAGQRNLKILVAVSMAVIAAGIYFQINEMEWLAIVLAIALVITTELINTAIENAVNLISPQHHPLAGMIKDIAAGAVLFSTLMSVVIGVIIFGKYLLS